MTFYRGQRVVYVGPDFSEEGRRESQIVPLPGAIYTIRAINCVYGIPAFLLCEIKNAPRRWHCGKTFEMHMNAEFFRPLVDKTTDISFAHQILRKATKKAPSKERQLT